MGGLPTGRAEEQHSSGGPGCRSPEHGAGSATPREGGAVMWGDPQGRGAGRWEQSTGGGALEEEAGRAQRGLGLIPRATGNREEVVSGE